jgi:4-phospho-D-threonate 3-dehydrogenase / 4-phospho-D-erythronate 3-dehydrogenase
MTPKIGITLGDAGGIGPEVLVKSLASLSVAEREGMVVIGDLGILREEVKRQRISLEFDLCGSSAARSLRAIDVIQPLAPLERHPPPGSGEAARAAVSWLDEGAQRCLAGELDALVTGPVNKESIIQSGTAFVGQTEYLSDRASTTRTVMMLLGHDDRGRWLRVALATNHLPLKSVATTLSEDKVFRAIELSHQACIRLGIEAPRIGVCGLNPHAGEGGKMGTEELTIVAPAVERALANEIRVLGPLPADTLFYQSFSGKFDAIVAMYHDQGLAPLKMIAFDTGVNWTLGLPFVRTSPDHGTAYDIAGKGLASPMSMLKAIGMATQLAARPRPRPRT